MNSLLESHSYKPYPAKAKVIEDSARIPNQPYSYTGTVRTCGSGGTHATLTAAYAACVSGDIIQITSGSTLITGSEAGGYWLINTAKSVLVRGDATNNASCVIEQNAANAFAIRLRINSGIVFKDLTIKTNQNTPCLYCDGDEANRNAIFDNVVFQQNGTGGNALWTNITNALTNTTTRWFEFKNCTFNKNGADTNPGEILTDNSSNSTHLYTGCTFNVATNPGFRCVDTMIGILAMYDCNFIQGISNNIMLIGQDNALPTSTVGLFDFRGNKMRFTGTNVADGLIVGRGTDNVKVYNNEFYILPSSLATSCSLCLKSTSASVGNAIYKGNFCYAPRPFYIKGCSRAIISNNIFVANSDTWESFGFANNKQGADEVFSRLNVITNNIFLGKVRSIYIYNDPTAETADVSFKTCTVDSNKYSDPFGLYLYNAYTTTQYAFGDRYSFWQSSNEILSSLINKYYSQNFN